VTSAVTYRIATEDDFHATWDVFTTAADDLARRRGWPAVVRPPSPPERFLDFRRSAVRHDREGFWVAETGGAIVGFGIAVQREHIWYLAALHVQPRYQARGIGAEITRRALAAARPGSILTVGADARNPVSNALYGRFGMFPTIPLLELSGAVGPARRDRLRLVPGAPSPDDAARLDRLVLDAARPEDHAFWGATPAVRAYTLLDRDTVTGYAYLQGDGAIGPIAVASPHDLVAAVDLAVGEVAALGGTNARVRIPGVARPTIAHLLSHGWRYGDGVTLVLTSGPWGRWEGYVTSGGDALL
jgi:ribosomal protein S18 acetylase RimI-like enzyme